MEKVIRFYVYSKFFMKILLFYFWEISKKFLKNEVENEVKKEETMVSQNEGGSVTRIEDENLIQDHSDGSIETINYD